MNQPATQLVPSAEPALPRMPARPRAAATMAEFKRQVVQDVLRQIGGGATYRAAVAAVAATARWPVGAKSGEPVNERTIKRWYSLLTRRGATGVARKDRADTGRRRVAISRPWDQFAAEHGIDAKGRERIRDAMILKIRGAYQSGVPNAVQVQLDIRPDLIELTEAAAVERPDPERLRGDASLVPVDFIRRYQVDKLHAIHRADKGRWSNEVVPRIKRSREGLRRMEWVAGDVHPLDVVVSLEDGSRCHPSLIAWEDFATNDLFLTVVVPPKGRSVGRAEILASFAAMCADSQWGVPTNLYLDNGKEYNGLELADDMMDLSKLKDFNLWQDRDAFDARRHGVLRSTAYQPQGKIIEGFFSNLEQGYLSRLPGYTGGDRMNKRTDVLGHKPTPYPHGLAKLNHDVEGALKLYRQKTQNGHLDGRSPNQAIQEQIDAGWQSVVLDPREINYVFADVKRRQAKADGIHYDKRIYYSDALKQRTLPDQWVRVRVPIMGGDVLYVTDAEGEYICTVREARVYGHDDLAGPNERKRRDRALLAHLAANRVDFEQDAGARMHRAASVDPVPRATVGARISVDAGMAKIVQEAQAQLEARPPSRAEKHTAADQTQHEQKG